MLPEGTRLRRKVSSCWTTPAGLSVVRVEVLDAGESRLTFFINQGQASLCFEALALEGLRALLAEATRARPLEQEPPTRVLVHTGGGT